MIGCAHWAPGQAQASRSVSPATPGQRPPLGCQSRGMAGSGRSLSYRRAQGAWARSSSASAGASPGAPGGHGEGAEETCRPPCRFAGRGVRVGRPQAPHR